jgi:hypothetical protein
MSKRHIINIKGVRLDFLFLFPFWATRAPRCWWLRVLDMMLEDTKKYIGNYIVRIKVNYLFKFSNQRLLGSMIGKTLGMLQSFNWLLKISNEMPKRTSWKLKYYCFSGWTKFQILKLMEAEMISWIIYTITDYQCLITTYFFKNI